MFNDPRIKIHNIYNKHISNEKQGSRTYFVQEMINTDFNILKKWHPISNKHLYLKWKNKIQTGFKPYILVKQNAINVDFMSFMGPNGQILRILTKICPFMNF